METVSRDLGVCKEVEELLDTTGFELSLDIMSSYTRREYEKRYRNMMTKYSQ